MCIRAIDEGVIRNNGAKKTVNYMYLVHPLFVNQHRYISLSHWLLFYVGNHGSHKVLLRLLADFLDLCFFPYLQIIAVNCHLRKGIIGTLSS